MTIHEAVSTEGGNQSVLDHTIHVTYKLLPVERVHIIMITRGADDKLMTNECFQNESDLSRGIAASVVATGRTACFNDADQDSKSSGAGDKSKIPLINLICAAIKSSTGEVIGVITAFNKSDKCDSRSVPFNHCDECLLEIIATNMGVALNK
jgi:GAF domain